MKTLDNEEVTFESIDDHFYKFDSPEVLERNLELINPREDIATAFTLARPILVAMTASAVRSTAGSAHMAVNSIGREAGTTGSSTYP